MAYGLTNDFKFGTIGKFTAEEFEKLLIDELMPVIDKQFLTKPDKWNRALAGLSMGGMETKLITLRRPEVFGYWGLLSGGQYAPTPRVSSPRARPTSSSPGAAASTRWPRACSSKLTQTSLNTLTQIGR